MGKAGDWPELIAEVEGTGIALIKARQVGRQVRARAHKQGGLIAKTRHQQ